MAPNATEETDNHDMDIRDQPADEEDETDRGRGDYGLRRDYGLVEGYGPRGDPALKRDYGIRSDYGQRGDSNKTGDYSQRMNYANRRDYGRDNCGPRSFDVGERKFNEPDFQRYPRDSSRRQEDLDDQDFPYGTMRGNYGESKVSENIASDERERFRDDRASRGYGYGNKFGSRYSGDQDYGRSRYDRSQGRYGYGEPYGYDGRYGRLTDYYGKTSPYGKYGYDRSMSQRPFMIGGEYGRYDDYDRMDYGRNYMYGRYGSGMRGTSPYSYGYNQTASYGYENPYEDSYRDRQYGYGMGFEGRDSSYVPYGGRYGRDFGRPRKSDFGYGRDMSSSRDNYYRRNPYGYNPYQSYSGYDRYSEEPYGRSYGSFGRNYSYGKFDREPFRRDYSNTRSMNVSFDSEPYYSYGKGSYGRGTYGSAERGPQGYGYLSGQCGRDVYSRGKTDGYGMDRMNFGSRRAYNGYDGQQPYEPYDRIARVQFAADQYGYPRGNYGSQGRSRYSY